jgi:hypothetical protein
MWKEVVMAWFKVISQHLYGWIKESQKTKTKVAHDAAKIQTRLLWNTCHNYYSLS